MTDFIITLVVVVSSLAIIVAGLLWLIKKVSGDDKPNKKNDIEDDYNYFMRR